MFVVVWNDGETYDYPLVVKGHSDQDSFLVVDSDE